MNSAHSLHSQLPQSFAQLIQSVSFLQMRHFGSFSLVFSLVSVEFILYAVGKGLDYLQNTNSFYGVRTGLGHTRKNRFLCFLVWVSPFFIFWFGLNLIQTLHLHNARGLRQAHTTLLHNLTNNHITSRRLTSRTATALTLTLTTIMMTTTTTTLTCTNCI